MLYIFMQHEDAFTLGVLNIRNLHVLAKGCQDLLTFYLLSVKYDTLFIIFYYLVIFLLLTVGIICFGLGFQ